MHPRHFWKSATKDYFSDYLAAAIVYMNLQSLINWQNASSTIFANPFYYIAPRLAFDGWYQQVWVILVIQENWRKIPWKFVFILAKITNVLKFDGKHLFTFFLKCKYRFNNESLFTFLLQPIWRKISEQNAKLLSIWRKNAWVSLHSVNATISREIVKLT